MLQNQATFAAACSIMFRIYKLPLTSVYPKFWAAFDVDTKRSILGYTLFAVLASMTIWELLKYIEMKPFLVAARTLLIATMQF